MSGVADSLSREERAAAALFPAGTAVAHSAAPPPDGSLLPLEGRATGTMTAARRQTFAQGRGCAHRALRQLGYGQIAVPVGEQRAPVWPAGVAGSISHCDGQAIAVAARYEVAASLGIDLERHGALESGVVEMICSPAERDQLRQTALPSGERLLFAIKESVYKCLWPRVRRFVDFGEVEIQLDVPRRAYRAAGTGLGLDAELIASLRGRFVHLNGLWLASAYLPPPAP